MNIRVVPVGSLSVHLHGNLVVTVTTWQRKIYIYIIIFLHLARGDCYVITYHLYVIMKD